MYYPLIDGVPAMNSRFAVLSVFALVPLASSGDDRGPKHPSSEFENAEIRVESNATDGDTEVVIFAKGGDDGFRHFTVRSPDGRTVVALHSSDRSVMGQREILLESPEPPGAAILAAYPEGFYHFKGQTHQGEHFAAKARLSHTLPGETTIISPIEDASVDAEDGLSIQWSAVPGLAQYVIELENESADPERTLTFNLPPEATSFDVPASLLTSGDYQLGIGTVAENGNIVFVEVGFEVE